MAKTKEEEKKEKTALIVIPILGLGAFLAWLFRKKPPVNPDLAILYGLVTDAETQQGIPNINVDCNGYTGKTNANGEYEIINIPPGTYSVTFTDASGRYEGVTI